MPRRKSAPRRVPKMFVGTTYAYNNPGGRRHGRRARAARTIQGAYRNRRQFRKNLQPFVETKSLETGADHTIGVGDNAPTDAFTIYTPDCFLYKTQGVADDEMVGDSCYSRYLTTKLLLKFPQGTNQIITPTQLWVYQIWVTAGLKATPYTGTGSADFKRDTVTKTVLENWITSQCQEFFATKNDRMDFNERLHGIKIIKKFKVRPQRQTSIGLPSANGSAYANVTRAGYTQAFDSSSSAAHPVPAISTVGNITEMVGGPPDVFKTFNWPVKVKEHYQESSELTDGHTHYLNNPARGYPALIIFNPDFAGQAVSTSPAFDRRIQFSVNSKHWYGDQ